MSRCEESRDVQRVESWSRIRKSKSITIHMLASNTSPPTRSPCWSRWILKTYICHRYLFNAVGRPTRVSWGRVGNVKLMNVMRDLHFQVPILLAYVAMNCRNLSYTVYVNTYIYMYVCMYVYVNVNVYVYVYVSVSVYV